MTEGSTRQAAPRRFPPIHPFLLAAYPIIFLFGQNLGEASIGEIIVPLVISLLVTSAIYGLTTLLMRDADRGALVASLAVVTIFGYGRIRDALADTPASGGRLLLAWASLTVVTFIAIVMVGPSDKRSYVCLRYWSHARGLGSSSAGYLRAAGKRRLIVRVPIPGEAAAVIRAGADLAPDRAVGHRTWEDFLAARLGGGLRLAVGR